MTIPLIDAIILATVCSLLTAIGTTIIVISAFTKTPKHDRCKTNKA